MKLSIQIEDDEPRSIDVSESSVSVGRGSHNDIVIPRPYVSHLHAKFVRAKTGQCELIDCDSSNGTFLNGEKIQQAFVRPGDLIRFGAAETKVSEESATGIVSISPSPKTEIAPVSGGGLLDAAKVQSPGANAELEEARARLEEKDSEIKKLKEQAKELQKKFDKQEKAIVDKEKKAVAVESERNDLKKRLKEKESDLAKLESSEREVSRLTGRNKDLQDSLLEAAREIEGVRNEVGSLQTRIRKYESQLKDLDRSRKEVGRLEGEKEKALGSLKEKEESLVEARGEIDFLMSRISGFEAKMEELAEAREDINSSIRELDTVREEIGKVRIEEAAVLAEFVQKKEETESELTGMRSSVDAEIAETKVEADVRLRKVKGEVGKERKTVEELVKEREKLRDDLAKLRENYDNLKKELADRKEELAEVCGGLEDAKESQSGVNAEVEKLSEERERLEKEISEKNAVLGELERDIESKAELRKKLDGAEKRCREIEKRELKVAKHELRLFKQSDKEKSLGLRLKELRRDVTDAEKRFHLSKKKLDRKLGELKMAEDRILMAEEITAQIRERRERLEELNRQIELERKPGRRGAEVRGNGGRRRSDRGGERFGR